MPCPLDSLFAIAYFQQPNPHLFENSMPYPLLEPSVAGGAGTIFTGQHFPLASGSKDIHDAIHYFSEWHVWATDSIIGFFLGQNGNNFIP